MPLVIRDLEERGRRGLEVYGVPLTAYNGRDALRDLADELLDGICYLKQLEVEIEDLRARLERAESQALYWRTRAESAR